MTNSGWAEQYGESHSPKSVVGAEPHTFVLVSNNVSDWPEIFVSGDVKSHSLTYSSMGKAP